MPNRQQGTTRVDDPRKHDEPQPSILGRRLLLGTFALAAAIMIILLMRGVIMPLLVDQIGNRLTSTSPTVLAQSDLNDEEEQAVSDRVDTFRELVTYDLEEGTHALTITEDELNALLQDDDPDPNDPTIRIQIEDGQLRGEVSFQLETTMLSGAWKRLAGRHVHGIAALDLKIVNGQLDLRINELIVQDRRVPRVLWRATLESRLKSFLEDPEVQSLVAEVDTLEITSDGITLLAEVPPATIVKTLAPSEGL